MPHSLPRCCLYPPLRISVVPLILALWRRSLACFSSFRCRTWQVCISEHWSTFSLENFDRHKPDVGGREELHWVRLECFSLHKFCFHFLCTAEPSPDNGKGIPHAPKLEKLNRSRSTDRKFYKQQKGCNNTIMGVRVTLVKGAGESYLPETFLCLTVCSCFVRILPLFCPAVALLNPNSYAPEYSQINNGRSANRQHDTHCKMLIR